MSGDNIVYFPGITTLDTDPGRVIEGALRADLEGVVILGRRKDGDLYFASSFAGSPEVLWHLERAKHELFQMEDAIREGGDPRGPKGAS